MIELEKLAEMISEAEAIKQRGGKELSLEELQAVAAEYLTKEQTFKPGDVVVQTRAGMLKWPHEKHPAVFLRYLNPAEMEKAVEWDRGAPVELNDCLIGVGSELGMGRYTCESRTLKLFEPKSENRTVN
ncbi:MAG TPA: hypothetical protein PKY99_00075 [Turneriella sp.]|nr:hypothetical protein [Turneriella sp.]